MISVIVPTYREAPNIKPLLGRLHASLLNAGLKYEVILVDDNSQDGIEDVVRELQTTLLPVRLIVRREERGLSSAVLRGFLEAQGDVLVCMDADLSHPPERVPGLVQCLADGECEFAIGSRYVPGGGAEDRWGLLRRLNSKVATVLARPFTKVKDPMAGFFAIPKHVFNRAVDLDPVGFKIGLELLVKCGCRHVREIPIIFMQRERGQSKMTLRQQWDYLRHLKRLADFKFGVMSRFLRFCLVGVSGMCVDLMTYYMLLALGGGIHLSRAIAIFVALNSNFLGNLFLTFHCDLATKLLQRYVGFVLSCSLGALVSWVISTSIALHMPYFREHLLVAAILGIFAGALTNFAFCEKIVFRRSRRVRLNTPSTNNSDLPGVYPRCPSEKAPRQMT